MSHLLRCSLVYILTSTTWCNLEIKAQVTHTELLMTWGMQQEIPSHARTWEWIWTGIASWYDYDLPKRENGTWRSKTHNTCAIRKYERYSYYKVCNVSNRKCVTCYHNDFWPKPTNRIVDLSSSAFREIWSLKRWLAHVTIERIYP